MTHATPLDGIYGSGRLQRLPEGAQPVVAGTRTWAIHGNGRRASGTGSPVFASRGRRDSLAMIEQGR